MNKKGVALILILSIVLMFSIISIGVLSRSISESNLARRYLKSTQAFWVAEAGKEAALLPLDQNWYDPNLPDGNLGAGIYVRKVYSNLDSGHEDLTGIQRRIVSTGVVGSVEREVEVVLERTFAEIFEYALAGIDLVELKDGVTVHGNVYADGDVEVKAGASVVRKDDSTTPVDPNAYDADVYYTGVVAGIGGTVEGVLIHTAKIIAPPDVDFGVLKGSADFTIPGGTTLSGVLADGIYYVEGDVKIDNVTLDRGAIISDGKMQISGGFTLNHPVGFAPVLANQTGTIEIKDSAEVKGLIYCGGQGLELKSGGTMVVCGSVVSSSSNIEIRTNDGGIIGSVDVYYKAEYLAGFEENSMKQVSWREAQNSYRLIP